MMTIIHKVFSVRFDQFFIWNKLKERKRHWTFLCKESYFIPFFEDLTNISFYENKSPFCKVGKVGKILKGSLDSIPSPSPSLKIQIMGGKVCLTVKAKHYWALTTNFLYLKVWWQHPMFCLYTFPAHNLNFHWRWRWWHRIRAIFLNLFYFTKISSNFKN